MMTRFLSILTALLTLAITLPLRAQTTTEGEAERADSLSNLSVHHYFQGNYDEAIRLGTEVVSITEKTVGKEHSDHAAALNNLSLFCAKSGNFAEAIRWGSEALSVRERVLGKEHADYVVTLNNLSYYNAYLGNYAEAIRLGTEALNIVAKVMGKENADYAIALSNLAGYHSELGNHHEALRLETEALAIRERVLGREHSDVAQSLSNLAQCNAALGNYDEAVRLVTEALGVQEKALGREHPYYAASLNNLAAYHASLGNCDEAIRLISQVLAIREKVLGKEHPDYALSLSNLTNYYFQCGQYAEAARLATETNARITRLICNTFSSLTANERNLFWQNHQAWFEQRLPAYAYHIPSDTLAAAAYNAVLMSKGLLLNSEMEMNKLLLESGDQEVVEMFRALQTNRQRLDQLLKTPPAQRLLSTDSLEAAIGRQEKELVQRSKVYGDYTKNLSIDWRQVRDKLGERDVAVEFLRFGVLGDSIVYAALTLTREDSVPRLIPLFEKKDLEGIDRDAYYSSPRLARLVWKPLAGLLAEKENIYFAPAGELYNIAIENIPCFEGDALMTDRWNLHRLSSTRELALTREKTQIRSAAVYGGLDYDMTETTSSTRTIVDFLTLLPGTLSEAKAVSRMLRKWHVSTRLFTDSLGTETAFKKLSGTHTNLIHIATHGIFSPHEDTSLTHSGLAFAGANRALAGEPLPEGTDDGMLTASEIAHLDLRGLELLVLSACQSALGTVTGDGVFGLQRGFKKAGANALLMSLWSVDDTATQMLMTRFYENLTAGKNKHSSLSDAQRFVREFETSNHQRPYAHPRFWAAFILLDGID